MKTFKQYIAELSKGTLSRYVKRAHVDANRKNFENGVGAGIYDYRDPKDAKHLSAAWANQRKIRNRTAGVAKAVDRLAGWAYPKSRGGRNPFISKYTYKEETEINELSKGTLSRYIGKATDSAVYQTDKKHEKAKSAGLAYQHHEWDVGKRLDKQVADAGRKVANRMKGVRTAAKKLAREETEIGEAVFGGEKYRGRNNPNIRHKTDKELWAKQKKHGERETDLKRKSEFHMKRWHKYGNDMAAEQGFKQERQAERHGTAADAAAMLRRRLAAKRRAGRGYRD